MKVECSSEKPWGIHLAVRNEEHCPRCGWTAPGRSAPPPQQALPDGWAVIEGGAALAA
jgi:hypothetical protein